MPFAEGKTSIQVSPELRKKLKVLAAQKGFKSYDELLAAMLDLYEEQEQSAKQDN